MKNHSDLWFHCWYSYLDSSKDHCRCVLLFWWLTQISTMCRVWCCWNFINCECMWLWKSVRSSHHLFQCISTEVNQIFHQLIFHQWSLNKWLNYYERSSWFDALTHLHQVQVDSLCCSQKYAISILHRETYLCWASQSFIM